MMGNRSALGGATSNGVGLRRARRVARAGWLVTVGALLLIACGAEGGEAERINREGNRAYKDGKYQEALDAYSRAVTERPDLTEFDYNSGNALHRLGNYDRAVRESQKAAAEGTNDTRFRAYYSLGNHFAKQERWREAYESYRNALILEPGDMDSKYNLEVVLQKLRQQQEEQEQARQQQNGQQQGQGQQGQGQQGQQQGQGQQGQQGQQQGQGQGDPQQGQAGQQGQQQGQQGQSGAGAGGQTQPQPGGQAGRPSAASQQELRDALAQFERTVSIEEALRILDILAEQQRRQQQQVPAQPPGSNIKDQ
jgi:Ca-activated chloride channel homolog